MTTITRNLPWFIKDLGVSIIGEECYLSLVENLALGDVECLKYSLSKCLGIGIVVGGSIMKVPQLIIILRARSARGLSLTAFSFETLAYAINLFYAFRNLFPFSTYGENLFLTIQNALITYLIVFYSPRPRSNLLGCALAILLTAFLLNAIPSNVLSFLQLCTLPISVASKLPQIRQNHRARSTGQLSAFAVGSQFVGCLARLFTTVQEVGDVLLLASFLLALGLNGVLAVQLWKYWDADARKEETEMGRLPMPSATRKRIRIT